MRLLVTIIGLWICSYSYADQLAWISQADANLAVEKISKMKSIYIFCGCCSMAEPKKIKPLRVYAKFTNFENKYEVYVDYLDEDGITRATPLDLAYVWKKGLFKYKTIATILGLEHDQCEYLKDWENPKNVEEDI